MARPPSVAATGPALIENRHGLMVDGPDGRQFILALAACSLIRMPRLPAAPA